MTWALIRKELRQHWLALLFLALLTLLGYGLMLARSFLAQEQGSIFEDVRLFVIVLGTLSGLVLCHRLVVVEYSAKTQLFLEGLPVSRWRMVTVKYALGLAFLLGITAAVLGFACLLGSRHEMLSARFVAILAVRALSAAVCAYHFFFLMGLLGRYRLALYLVAVLALLTLEGTTSLQLDRFGPFALLDNRFAFERETLPWKALRATWGLSAVFLALTFLLALTREGAVASVLAEKMSHREKVFIAALLIGLCFAAGVLDEKKQRAPFDLHDAVTEQRPGVVTKVAASTEDQKPAARELARQVADELAAVREYLGIGELPPVFITRRRDLDADRYERGELQQASGVHVQVNYGAEQFQPVRFTAWLRREVLLAYTGDAAKFEPKMWVLDGFALFDLAPGQAAAPLAEHKPLALRALYGQDLGFTPADLARWYGFRERVGADIAAGVAWSGLKTLAGRAGPERCRNFLRTLLGAEVPKDFRALRHERATRIERVLPDATGIAFDQFWAQWQEQLASARGELAADLARLPKVRGEIAIVPLSAESRQIRYHVHIEPPPLDSARYSFLHHQLPAFDEEVAPQSIRRELNFYSRQPEGDLPDTVARGARLYWTFSLDAPALGCPVIAGWHRDEIR